MLFCMKKYKEVYFMKLLAFFLLFAGVLFAQTYQKVQSFGTEYFKHDMPVRGVAFSPDGKYLISGDEKYMTLWDRKTGTKIKNFSKVEHGIIDLQYTPDGSKLAIEDGC